MDNPEKLATHDEKKQKQKQKQKNNNNKKQQKHTTAFVGHHTIRKQRQIT